MTVFLLTLLHLWYVWAALLVLAVGPRLQRRYERQEEQQAARDHREWIALMGLEWSYDHLPPAERRRGEL